MTPAAPELVVANTVVLGGLGGADSGSGVDPGPGSGPHPGPGPGPSPGSIDPPVDITIGGGRILSIEPAADRHPPDAEVIDGSGWRMAPGLIDLQVNGGWGHDLASNPETVWEVGAGLSRLGVTAWLPTLISSPVEVRRRALDVLADGPPAGWVGAEPLGWHFEGPYLNPDHRGAHRAEALEPIPPASRRSSMPLPRLMTLAPELDGALDLIAEVTATGVTVSLGHTGADAATVTAALEAGASMGTHLFNAMTGITHRRPGAAVGLLNSGAWLGLIADGHHVDPEVMRLVWSLAADRIVLVSDAMAGLGLPDGPTRLGAREVEIAGGTVRLPDRTLAGSVLPLDEAVVRLSHLIDVPLADTVAAATAHPAQVLGLQDRGRIAVGARADLVAFDTDDRIATTILSGENL